MVYIWSVVLKRSVHLLCCELQKNWWKHWMWCCSWVLLYHVLWNPDWDVTAVANWDVLCDITVSDSCSLSFRMKSTQQNISQTSFPCMTCETSPNPIPLNLPFDSAIFCLCAILLLVAAVGSPYVTQCGVFHQIWFLSAMSQTQLFWMPGITEILCNSLLMQFVTTSSLLQYNGSYTLYASWHV